MLLILTAFLQTFVVPFLGPQVFFSHIDWQKTEARLHLLNQKIPICLST